MKEQFKFMMGTDGSKKLIMESCQLEACIQYVLQGHISSVTINPYQGFNEPNVEFLNRLAPVLKGLHIPQCDFEIGVINNLHELEFLGFEDNGRDTVDLANFPNLEILATTHSKRLVNLGSCRQLKSLSLSKLKSAESNLRELPNVESLQEFCLFQSSVNSLSGIEGFNNLRRLGLYLLPKLSKIGSLISLSQRLESLEIESCKKIIDFDILGEMKALRRVHLVMAVEIPSLSFIQTMPNLSNLAFVQTNILDGDLSYCESVDQVAFDEKRHYNRKMKDFIR